MKRAGDAAAIFIRAAVGGISQKLLRQIAIGGMQLHAVKSGGHGILGRLGVVGNDLANFRQRQFARRFIFLHALRGEMLRAFNFDG